MNCPYCSEELPDRAKRCDHCGERLGLLTPRAATASPVAIVAGGVGLALLILFGASLSMDALFVTHHGHGNESGAIGALKTIGTCQSLFREMDKEQDGLLDYGTLQELSQQDLVDIVLGSGTKQGYLFDTWPSPQTGEFLWFAIANPAVPTTTGDRYFCTNHEGVTYYTTARGLTRSDVGPDCGVPRGWNPVGK